ncbi:hypothetical protein [Tranquillimonas alkanivorans]|uniref:Lipoprotein-attachment site-containing protein n=1 Tax=Tranquillimonas alkanivorans TaxID=441119 RepID=A0A1I5W7Y0_9RHOB|nr:hypothetical protein [Tranquillimonas alkanivorans]SFQ15326.1 hypothetical protein SAMN04488047_1411 [Tranquillimonas alkanivorans]
MPFHRVAPILALTLTLAACGVASGSGPEPIVDDPDPSDGWHNEIQTNGD